MCHHLQCTLCNVHRALCTVRYALCNWNVQSCVIAHCVLLCNHVSCTMCNWNVFVHSLILHSTRNDLIKRLLLYYSFHLFHPFHLSICFFVFYFPFHPFHLYICFHSVMHFSCSDLHSIFHFNDFCFFCHNLKFTSYKAALSPFSISPDLPTEHCIIPEDNSQCTSGTF